MPGIVYAAVDSVLAHGGQRIRVKPGEVWAADDPLVAQYPQAFTDQPRGMRVTTSASGWAEVEQATATPGEKRTTRRPRRTDA